MRLRLLIPAAMAAAATYAALVRDDSVARGSVAPAPAPPRHGVRPPTVTAAQAPSAPAAEPRAARAPTVAAPSPFMDLAPSSPPSGAPTILDLLAGSPPPSGSAAPDPAPYDQADEPDPVGAGPAPYDHGGEAATGGPDISTPAAASIEEGRFALGGWAAAPGHSVVSAVTFRRRLPVHAGADRIVLEIDASDNVPEGGLVVLSDPGFAPDRDGFTLLLAAADPGPFSAAGSYRVLPAG